MLLDHAGNATMWTTRAGSEEMPIAGWVSARTLSGRYRPYAVAEAFRQIPIPPVISVRSLTGVSILTSPMDPGTQHQAYLR